MEQNNQKLGLIEWAMRYKAFPLAIAVIFSLLGIYALYDMPRNEFPNFTIRQGIVIGIYPGASSEKVEEQLTKKVEEYIFSFNEVNKEKTYSYSKDGMMYIFVEVAGRVDDKDTKIFWNKLKHGTLLLNQQLPKDVLGIIVNSDFGSTSSILLSIESKARGYKSLEKNVEAIEEKLRGIHSLAKISRVGNQTEKINVYVENDKLLQHGIVSAMIYQAIQKESSVYPLGVLEGDITDKPLRVAVNEQSEAALKDLVVKADLNGNVVRLKDIAKIVREYDEPDSYIRTNGTKSILISMEMANGYNIVHFGKEVDKKLAEIKQDLPEDITMTYLADQPKVVDHSIAHFMKEFGFALLGVLIVTILLLPKRIAAVAAATIPITIACTLAIMYLMGLELNTVTLAALIIVLGIVVDDPIVVIDNYVEQLDHGYSHWEAAKKSAKELFPSVFTATLAIAATFTPIMFFLTGTAKDFISVFPLVITIALTLSLVVSMLLVPFINTVFIKQGLSEMHGNSNKKSLLDYLQDGFNWAINKALAIPRIMILLGIGSVFLGGFLFSKLPQQLFPKVDRNQFAIEVYLPSGYALEQTDAIVKNLESELSKDERIVSFASFIGSSSPRFHTVYAPNLPSKNYAQILIATTDDKTTEVVLSEYEKKYSNLYPSAYVRMKQLSMVPTPGPIEVRIAGHEISDLKKVADQVQAIVKEHPLITWVRTDFDEKLQSYELVINHDEAAKMGLSKQDISNFVAMNMNGLKATTIYEGAMPVDVVIKTTGSKEDLASLMALNIPVQSANAIVPLRQVAKVEPVWNEGQIVRRNGVRTLTVRMDVVKDAVPSKIVQEIMPKINEIELPRGCAISLGGEHEMQMENMGPMGLALGTSVVIIFLILVWHFKSFTHAILSLTTMPLSILGAALGLMLMGYPFGFTCFIGILALCGIVVRNGVILIDYADEIRVHENLTVKQAAILAAERRMRPIFLTSAAAAIGVIPMIISRSSLWGPLGTVICFGLLVSMVLTLFVLPALYYVFFKSKDKERATANQKTSLSAINS